jgi:putative PEP-CTERM system histidine kinase
MALPTAPSLFALLALLSSVALALAALRTRPRQPFHVWFALGMTAFAGEALTTLMLVQRADPTVDGVFWVGLLSVLSPLTPLAWAGFVFCGRPSGQERAGPRVAVLGALAAGVLGLAALQRLAVLRVNGFVEVVRFDAVGRAGLVVALLATVAVLAGLERHLRRVSGTERWVVKYLVIGLGAIFLGRFVLLTKALLFTTAEAGEAAAGSAFVALGNAAIAVSLARGMRPIPVVPSRQVVFGSTVVLLLGFYLFGMAVLGWAVRRFEVPNAVLWTTVLTFVAGVVLAALLLSDHLRWRLRRFLARHFYRSKYDYREQWRAFTARLASLMDAGEQAPRLLQAVVDAVGAEGGCLYRSHAVDGRFRCAASLRVAGPLPAVDGGAPLLQRLQRARAPLPLDAEAPGGDDGWTSRFALAVPLVWGERLLGVIFLAPEQGGDPYGPEDLEFLATVGEQAAGTLALADAVEASARAREFEAFHRLTSFVLHDVKNSVSALSMLSRNALDHFDDPEFQRDALRTISSTAARMKALLARLQAPAREAVLAREEVKLDVVAADVLAGLRPRPGLSVVTDFEPVRVLGDPEALATVVANLVVNAVEAVPGEGTVTVRTGVAAGEAVVEVADTGVGMSDEYVQNSLFVPFRSGKPGGWGLGLYQAREIVHRHGGRITVASRPGQGTTFTVVLPLADGVDRGPEAVETGGAEWTGRSS